LTGRLGSVTFIIASRMADGQVGLMAVAAFAEWLNVFQRCIKWRNMQAAHPARYLAMQLAGDGVVDFLPGVGEFAHVVLFAFCVLQRAV